MFTPEQPCQLLQSTHGTYMAEDYKEEVLPDYWEIVAFQAPTLVICKPCGYAWGHLVSSLPARCCQCSVGIEKEVALHQSHPC